MMAHIYFLISSIGFASGIFFRSFFDLGWSFSFFVVMLSVMLLILFFYGARRRGVLMFAVFIFAAAIGMLRFDIADIHRGDVLLDARVGDFVRVEGVIVDEPDEREKNTYLRVRADRLLDYDGARVDSKILVSTEHYPVREYGDRVIIEGELRLPDNFTTDTGREFNYRGFLEKDGIYYRMFYPDIELTGKGEGNIAKTLLFSVKHMFLDSVSRSIPEPHVSLLGGLLVGAKRSLGGDLLSSFRTAGIIHIVVLSGYNVTIVADAIMRFFYFLPRIPRIFLGVGSILSFMVMVGSGATVVRASIMSLIIVLARAVGRIYEATLALVFAGIIMLLFNPRILVFDPSFQLSFLATIGLMYFSPLIEKYFRFIPTMWNFRDYAVATVATQLFVLPLLLYMTGELSVVALPVNLLILAAIPTTMLFGFLAGVAGFIGPLLAAPFSFVSYILLDYELFVTEIFSALPFASISIPEIPMWAVFVFYIFYGALFLYAFKYSASASKLSKRVFVIEDKIIK